LQCTNKLVLQNLALLLAPFAPHLADELWQLLGYQSSISTAPFPSYDEQYLQEDSYEYPIAINGKIRAKITFSLDVATKDIEQQVLNHEIIQKWLQGQKPKKIIIVPKKMVNIVV
jgi:leucyl-tRNA synthetase